MKARPTPATLSAVERVIAAGEELTPAEIATRAGMRTRYAREVLAVLVMAGRLKVVDGGMVGALALRLYARDEPRPEPEEIVRGGGFSLLTHDPVVKALVRKLGDQEQDIRLLKAMRPPRGRQARAQAVPHYRLPFHGGYLA